MLNQILLMGRLTRDPELRHTQAGTAVASFTLAVNRDYDRDEVDFIDCVAWRSAAEFISRHFVKGQMMALSGRLQMRGWVDHDGANRRSAEVVVGEAYFCGGKGDGGKGEIATPALPPVRNDSKEELDDEGEYDPLALGAYEDY